MILEMLVWGFFSAWGWIGATTIKDKVWPDPPAVVIVKEEKQLCSSWEETDNGDGTKTRNRTCNFLKD